MAILLAMLLQQSGRLYEFAPPTKTEKPTRKRRLGFGNPRDFRDDAGNNQKHFTTFAQLPATIEPRFARLSTKLCAPSRASQACEFRYPEKRLQGWWVGETRTTNLRRASL